MVTNLALSVSTQTTWYRMSDEEENVKYLIRHSYGVNEVEKANVYPYLVMTTLASFDGGNSLTRAIEYCRSLTT